MILLDSSLIIAYSNKSDVNHEKAIKIMKDVDRGRYGTPVITDYIFDEVVTVMLLKTKNLLEVVKLGETLINATLLFRVDENVFKLAWEIFKKQSKPRFSFTDCTNIATCRLYGITTIATFDKGFKGLKELNVVGPE